MAFILWRSAFSVGNLLIDNQHQKLIGIINQLYDGISSRNPEMKMQEVFNELVQYTKYHFEAEEKMMMMRSYGRSAHHKKAHQDFITRVNDLKLNTILGDEKIKMEVFKFLKSWLMDHILNEDKAVFAA